MESQNHFYGHSAAFAAYLGMPRPKHIAGLVQHGWTAVSPVGTHFRDFPQLGSTSSGPRLLVWSHHSRAWDPSESARVTTPIGAQFAYLTAAMSVRPEPRDEQDRAVLMPVHGIETQRVRGDHAALAQLWREAEGPATACLYAADAKDPEILAAYQGAGHRVVTLGSRLDPAFLWRLWTMLGRAERVVSNRLSTPVIYAGHLGVDVGVYGDPLALDGESAGSVEAVAARWPELHGERTDQLTVRELCDRELGVEHLLPPAELATSLGWDGAHPTPFVRHWSTSPAQRAVINIKRRRAAAAASPAVPDASADGSAGGSASGKAPEAVSGAAGGSAHGKVQEAVSGAAWLRAAMTYLPERLPRTIPPLDTPVEPLTV